jgi:predicted nucleotidyltransferase component of viral defense system
LSRPRATGFVQSVQDRLRNKARSTGRPFSEVVELYTVERFLHRLGRSAHRERFVLKGAHLLRTWLGAFTRPTRDIDLYGPAGADSERTREELVEILTTDVEDDAVEFDLTSLSIRPIRNAAPVLGQRAKLDAYIGRIRIRCQIDVGMGDVIFPPAEPMTMDSLLDMQTAIIHVYTPYTSIAEKLEAMVLLGLANTRMKDYFDLMTLSSALTFDGPTLVEAIRRTFGRRSTPIPEGAPEGLSKVFGRGEARAVRWRAFLSKSRLQQSDPDFERVVGRVRTFALPALEAVRTGSTFRQVWPPGGPWREPDVPHRIPEESAIAGSENAWTS